VQYIGNRWRLRVNEWKWKEAEIFCQKKAIPERMALIFEENKKPGNFLLSHSAPRAVPSAPEGLASVFGMGTGVSPLSWLPGFSD